MFVTAAFVGLLGVGLTVAIVVWAAGRLGLPITETLLWFGLLEHSDEEPSGRPPRGDSRVAAWAIAALALAESALAALRTLERSRA